MRRFNTMVVTFKQHRVEVKRVRSMYSLKSRLAKALKGALEKRGIKSQNPINVYASRCSA